MQNSPLVSIICLCYNHANFVEQALDSVLSQSYTNIELLIADDCSTDNSKEVINKWLEKHPNIIFIANTTNRGNTKTFNSLLKMAKGEYIIDLAADDVLLPDCVIKQLTLFKTTTFENLAVVYGNAQIISEKGEDLGYYYPINQKKEIENPPPKGNIYLSVLGQHHKICSVSSMVKRSVLDSVGGYDENLAYEDLDLWIRVSKNYNFDFTPETLIQKRELATSLGSQFFVKNNLRTKQLNKSTYIIIQKALKQNTKKEENKALLKRIHFEMMKVLKAGDYSLFVRYIFIELKTRFL